MPHSVTFVPTSDKTCIKKNRKRIDPMRTATMTRTTKETSITARINMEGAGTVDITTPIGMLSHLLSALCTHARFDLTLDAVGDVDVDQHHTVEDCGLVLGQAISKALGPRDGIARAGCFTFPMDEALAFAAVDLSGRPALQWQACFRRRFCGGLDLDTLEDFLQGLSRGLQGVIAVDILRGRSDHHMAEAGFKALGRALRMACQAQPGGNSSKGMIDRLDSGEET